MDTKSLKKQLGAAIAMVLVAAVALGSATYAWFVSNNTVTATSNNVYAMSNSAYLVIANKEAGKTSTESTSTATASETTKSVALYPATWDNTFTAEKGSERASGTAAGVYQFETAYASDKGGAREIDDTAKTSRFAIGAPADAISKDAPYAYLNTFYIGTGTYAGIFKDLKVTGFEVSNTAGQSRSELTSAMRALVECDGNWAVVKMGDDGKAEVVKQKDRDGSDNSPLDGIIRSDQFGQINKTQTDATVDVYLFYEGSDDNVYTTNLANLSDCKVKISFEATPTEYGKN